MEWGVYKIAVAAFVRSFIFFSLFYFHFLLISLFVRLFPFQDLYERKLRRLGDEIELNQIKLYQMSLNRVMCCFMVAMTISTASIYKRIWC